MEDTIVLTDKDEIEMILGDEISDDTWLEIKIKIMQNKHMWQIIDDTISEVCDEYHS